MSGYSEQEMLLLDNFMYLGVSSGGNGVGRSIKELLDSAYMKDGEWDFNAIRRDASGGLEDATDQELKQLLDEMASGRISGLVMDSNNADKDGIRAACFLDNGGATPIVAFRGTGGVYRGWRDNFEGATVNADDDYATPGQKAAAEYINGLNYDNLTVTGHSKGGNLAMYVTVVCQDKVDNCVSFDGQGFNNEFCENYAEEIESAKGKITSICANNDFVSPLLNSIAGKMMYVQNDIESFFDGHSSMKLYFNNKDGWIETDQDFVMGLIHDLSAVIDKLPIGIGGAIADAVGIIISAIMSDDTNGWRIALDIVESVIDNTFSGFSALISDVKEKFKLKGIESIGDFFDYAKEHSMGETIGLLADVIFNKEIVTGYIKFIIGVEIKLVKIGLKCARKIIEALLAASVGINIHLVRALRTFITVVSVIEIAVVYVGIKYIVENWDEIKAAMSKAFEVAKDFISNLVETIKSKIKTLIKSVATSIASGAKKLWNKVIGVAKDVKAKINSAFNNLIGKLIEAFQSLQGERVRDFSQRVRETLLGATQERGDEDWWRLDQIRTWDRVSELGSAYDSCNHAARINRYFEDLIDINCSSRQELTKIFNDVDEADEGYADKFDSRIDALNQVKQRIDLVKESIVIAKVA